MYALRNLSSSGRRKRIVNEHMQILKIIAYYNMLWKIKNDEGKKLLFWKGARESASKKKTFKLKPE